MTLTAATVLVSQGRAPLRPVPPPGPVPARGAPPRSAARRTPQPPQAPGPGQRAPSGRCHTVTAPRAGAVRVRHTTPAPHGVRAEDHAQEAAERARQRFLRHRRSPQPGPALSRAPTPAAPPHRMEPPYRPAGPRSPTPPTQVRRRKDQAPPKRKPKPKPPPAPAPNPPTKPETPMTQTETSSYRPTLSTPRRLR